MPHGGYFTFPSYYCSKSLPRAHVFRGATVGGVSEALRLIKLARLLSKSFFPGIREKTPC